MKLHLFNRSLSHRFGLAIACITLLAFISIIAAIFVIAQAGTHAAAVNAAGSLRMQSYRISTALLGIQSRIQLQGENSIDLKNDEKRLDVLIDRFTAQLESEQLYDVRKAAPDSNLGMKYQRVESLWKRQIVPMLNQLLQFRPDSAEYRALSDQYLEEVNSFVAHIDQFVLALQHDSEQKIRILGLISLFCVFCTVGIAYGVMYLLNASVIIPLAELVEVANQFKQGNFKARSTNPSTDELGILAQTYNQMAESISQQYERLENTVAEKTGALKRSNLTLEFLYNTSRKLASSSDPDTLRSILIHLQEVAELKYLLLCYKPDVNSKYYELINFGTTDIIYPAKLANAPALLESMTDLPSAETPAVLAALVEGQNHYGYLYAEAKHLNEINDWKKQLIQNVADQLAAAYSLQHQDAQERLLMLFEERAVIARELHDSLAQSLSYLKMQITRLKTLLSRDAEEEVIMQVSNELQDGLNSAYRNLRELLNTFRLKITHPSLQSALESTVKEFKKFSGVPIALNYSNFKGKLTPNEDIHVLQIVREAVSNAVKHASASKISIDCKEATNGKVTFAIIDDGIGISEDASKKYHYGLSIMKERAKSLNGVVSVGSRAQGGTQVTLEFVPQTLVENHTRST